MTHIGSDANETYRSDLFTNQLRSFDELLVGRGLAESMREVFDSQFAHRCANPQCFNTVAPEELVAEEGFDDRRNASCS